MAALFLTLRFVLELSMLAAFAVAGWELGGGGLTGGALAVLLPVCAAALWGAFVAPKASRRLARGPRVALECVIFGLAALGLAVAGHGLAAAVLAGVYVVDTAAIGALGADDSAFGR